MRYLKSLALAGFFGLLLAPSALAASSVGEPNDLDIKGGRYTNDTTPTFTWEAGDGATWYDVRIDGGSYTGIGNVFRYTSSSLKNGWHTFYVRAHDNRNHVSDFETITFEIDTIGPTVSKPTSDTVYEDQKTEFTVKTSGESAVAACTLVVKEGKETSDIKMNWDSKNVFTADYTFNNDGKATVYAWCIDGDRNSTTGSTSSVTIKNSHVIDDQPSTNNNNVKKGDLVKLRCGSLAKSDDACHAVYYIGDDGDRHPFLNGEVFLSWYHDFDDVKTITSSKMEDYDLGETVLFKPGSVLVKFVSSPVIYAVDENSILRAYETENLVRADYGSNWKNEIVTVSDQLYSVFRIGSEIDSSGDFDPDDAFDDKHDWIDETFDNR